MTMLFIIIYPILTLILGYIIGSWRTEKKSVIHTEELSKPDDISEPQEPIQKKKDLGVVPRPTVEDLERKANPKLAESDEAWDTDMEKLFGSPYKLAIQTK